MDQNPSPEHQALVKALINHFQSSLGLSIIAAAYPGFTQPPAHGRHEPDVVALDQNGVLHLGEAKLAYDLSSDMTLEQLLDFSNRVMTNTSIPVPLHLVVYRQDEPSLQATLRYQGLSSNPNINVWVL